MRAVVFCITSVAASLNAIGLPVLFAGGISAEEQQIVDYIDGYMDEAEALLAGP